MAEQNPESPDQDHQSTTEKKTMTVVVVSVVLLIIVMLYALVFIVRGQLNQKYVFERYPIEELEARLKQRQPRPDNSR